MDRREFLKAGLLSLGAFMPGMAGWTYSGSAPAENRLIIVMLRGAVDGLNVVVPYGDPRYYDIRHSIAIGKPGTENGVIDLDGHFGLHPAMSPLMGLWKERHMAFVHNSGSPDPTRSHFDAQDYMETGIPGGKVVSTGWMNRLLTEIPNNHSPVRAVNFGQTMPRILAGNQSVAMAPEVLTKKRPINHNLEDSFAEMYTPRKDELGQSFRDGMQAEQQISDDLSSANDEIMKGSNGAPSPGAVANFGSKIATLLKRDPSVRVAFMAFGGWDTHVNEGAGKGQLANHLAPLGKGLAQLAVDLGPQFSKTTIVVMSEFGRTAKENGNGGTDHGHGNAMWVIGGNVNGGKVYGRWSSLDDHDLHESRDLPVTTDFRDVLSSVVSEQLQVSSKGMQEVFPDFHSTNKIQLLA